MWIEKTKSGKYKYVEQYNDYMTGKKKRVSVTLEKNTAAARKTAAETLVRMIDEAQNLPPEKVELTLSELIEKYRDYQRVSVKASTYQRNFYQCKTIMNLLGPDVLVDHLTANYIKERFLHSGKANSTLNEHRIRLLALLNWGYENDYIQDISFVRKFKPFKDTTHREKIKDKYLEQEELYKLLRNINIKKWELLTRFLSLSGLRIGEALSLTASDIDFKNSVIHVNKTFDANNKIVSTPKTLCSIRNVYIQEELKPVCKDILLHTKTESVLFGFRTDLFLCSNTGSFVNPASYNKYLRTLSEKVIGRRITAHTLRHTHASLLLANGVSIETISRRLGHENSSITKEIYLHTTEKLMERDNEQLKRIRII